jgi:cyclin B
LDTKDLTSQSTNFIPFDINEPMLVEDVMLIDEVVEDIDALDRDDPLSVTEYVNDIYAVLREREKQFRIPADYMKEQFDINERMRMILLDWLVEVHLKFRLLTDTLHLAVYIIDRYLSLKQIIRDELQLVGITAMLLASKYEEIYIPECGDFIYICGRCLPPDIHTYNTHGLSSSLSFFQTFKSFQFS